MISINKELRRKTNSTFLHYRKPLVVELLPGDIIQLRLYGQRDSSAVAISIQVNNASKNLNYTRRALLGDTATTKAEAVYNEQGKVIAHTAVRSWYWGTDPNGYPLQRIHDRNMTSKHSL